MNELLPYPFCDGEIENMIFPLIKSHLFRCKRCKAGFILEPVEGLSPSDGWNARNTRIAPSRHYPPEVQQAVEKMKPKKAIRKLDGLNCPRCDMFQTNEKKVDQPPFCWRCGQALDWSEDE